MIRNLRANRGCSGGITGPSCVGKYTPGVDQYTKLLIHSDTTNEADAIIDSATGKTVTKVGNVHHENTDGIAKFGVSSIYFDGVGDYLSIPDSDDWDYGSGNFTIEAWIYPTVGSVVQHIIGQATNSTNRFYFHLTAADKLATYQDSGATNITSAESVSINAWTHICAMRSGGTLYQFINGVSAGTDATPGTVGNYTGNLIVGIYSVNLTSFPFTGYVDGIRISKDVSRYPTTGFTPPTVPFCALG